MITNIFSFQLILQDGLDKDMTNRKPDVNRT